MLGNFNPAFGTLSTDQFASGLASILNATTPLFTVIVAGMLLPDERATPLKLLCVVAGFIGDNGPARASIVGLAVPQ
ncbi:hypothetical protein [uncultured Marinobacter sp.]|uniref:hypothetical protein n=1 Tax=uncultured Marinobacter sp. TaxID=187379 RepID=UPI0030D89757